MAETTPLALPARPSKGYLRKQAKRLARDAAVGLAEAQHRLAASYGFGTWADLMRQVEVMRGEDQPSRLAAAASAGDVAAVRAFLAEGDPVDGSPGGTPLWHACISDAPDAQRIAIAEVLLDAGANPRRDDTGATALHAAAGRGHLALVELLIRKGALEWQTDRKGRTPLQAAARSAAADRAAIMALLDRPVIRDPAFRTAVRAIHSGDVAGLRKLLDAEPRLLRERIVEPDCYREANRHQYFGDPKLFWFIANNPTLMEAMPRNIGEIAQAMIERGVEPEDLDYALELVMTSTPARDQGHQGQLMRILLDAGATATPRAITTTLAHREIAPVESLLASGHPMTLMIAAATGRTDAARDLLREASAGEIQDALGMAAINGEVAVAQMALDAGADPNGFVPVHRHATPLHVAVLEENLPLMELLLARGARLDLRDKLWNGTPLGWAIHQGKERAKALLERFDTMKIANADGAADGRYARAGQTA